MIDFLRKLAWRFLGIKYFEYLKGKNTQYLKDAAWTKVGKNTYDNGAFVWRWYKHSKLEIGKYCSIAANVNFICDSGYHTESEVTAFPLFHELGEKKGTITINGNQYLVDAISDKLRPENADIFIGNDVWIGMNATILPSVTIGNGVTILAGAVVTKDVPNYAIIGGVPASVVKMKHPAATIDALQSIAWWNWSESKIIENRDDFYLPIAMFIKKHG